MKAVIKLLRNSALPEDDVNKLAEVIKNTEGRISYRHNGTETVSGPLHKVTLLGGAIVISIPLSAPWVEMRLRSAEFERVLQGTRLDQFTLRNDGYHKIKTMTGEYCTVVCLCTLMGELLSEACRCIVEEYS